MGNNGITKLPKFVSPGDMAQRFSDYIIEKVYNIPKSKGSRRDDRLDTMVDAISDDTDVCGVPLTFFTSVTESDFLVSHKGQ